jgi:glucosylceramidase
MLFLMILRSKYAWGMGFHWYEPRAYVRECKKSTRSISFKKLIFTEGCVERFDADKYQLWANGERYGRSMINDFSNGSVAWTDWNILLDQNGGPNHVGNFCFAPLHADTVTDELIYTLLLLYWSLKI